MRVLHVNADWDQGGPGTIGKDICDILIEEGHECFVTYGRPSNVLGVKSCQIDTKLEVVSHAVLSRLLCDEGCHSKKATRKLISIIKSFRPDIVQLHNLLGHYLNHEMLFDYLKDNNICTVWTIHDCSPFTGHCINFDRVKCTKWKTLCFDCPLFHDYPYSYFLDRSKDNYLFKKKLYGTMDNLHLVVPSEWMCGIIKDSFLKELDISVIRNGIDLEIFEPKENSLRYEYGLENKTVLLAAAFNWNEMKGWNLLLEIAKKLSNEKECAIVAVGNKDETDLPSNIISIPVITEKEKLMEWYSTANIFINPTLGDNFPTVNIEALACGTPIVTCNTGGSPEIAGNEFGRVVYSNTSDEFVQKIHECLSSNITSEECCSRAKAFDRRYVYKEYINLYKRIINI